MRTFFHDKFMVNICPRHIYISSFTVKYVTVLITKCFIYTEM